MQATARRLVEQSEVLREQMLIQVYSTVVVLLSSFLVTIDAPVACKD